MDVTQLKLALRSGDLIILEHWIRLAERQLRNGIVIIELPRIIDMCQAESSVLGWKRYVLQWLRHVGH